ncbi:unnamed protein product [Oikopleura dioica]|uniref:AARP2CN domain-containing protein n=1 Tax=Oikopleura dioica TaxID=34765 RepID=E4XX62_OIKDI|nr:unnamed protein product [Oikopleura dioica]
MWRKNRPYLLVDKVEDLTDPEELSKNRKVIELSLCTGSREKQIYSLLRELRICQIKLLFQKSGKNARLIRKREFCTLLCPAKADLCMTRTRSTSTSTKWSTTVNENEKSFLQKWLMRICRQTEIDAVCCLRFLLVVTMLREDLPISATERKTTKRTMTILKAKKKSIKTKLKESSEVNSLPILTEKKQTILMQTKWTESFLKFSKNAQVAKKIILVTTRFGEIEVWLDRTLAQDDSRRMGQLVKDNSIKQNTFKIILESTSPSSNPDSIYLVKRYSNKLIIAFSVAVFKPTF